VAAGEQRPEEFNAAGALKSVSEKDIMTMQMSAVADDRASFDQDPYSVPNRPSTKQLTTPAYATACKRQRGVFFPELRPTAR